MTYKELVTHKNKTKDIISGRLMPTEVMRKKVKINIKTSDLTLTDAAMASIPAPTADAQKIMAYLDGLFADNFDKKVTGKNLNIVISNLFDKSAVYEDRWSQMGFKNEFYPQADDFVHIHLHLKSLWGKFKDNEFGRLEDWIAMASISTQEREFKE